MAFVIGESRQVTGVRSEMIALANATVFLQLWIGADDKLPRRIRAVCRDDPLRLRHEMDLTNWKVDSAIPPAAFTSEKGQIGQADAVPQPCCTDRSVMKMIVNRHQIGSIFVSLVMTALSSEASAWGRANRWGGSSE